MTPPVTRRQCVAGALGVAALLLALLSWHAAQRLDPRASPATLVPALRTRMAADGYTVVGSGATPIGEQWRMARAVGVSFRAWTPTPRISVRPRPGTNVVVNVANVPRHARLVAPVGVTEQPVAETGRVLIGPTGEAWEFQYAQADPSLSFAILGDTGASATFQQALETARRLGAHFLIVVGDLVYADSELTTLGTILRDPPVPVYVVRGNHDVQTATRREFIGQLAPPFYSFVYGGAAFVMLDSERMLRAGRSTRSEQDRWLTQTLANHGGVPVFAFLHRPPLRFTLEPLPWYSWVDRSYPRRLARHFERARVRYVFAGHLHEHHMSVRRGVTYVITGEGKKPQADGPVMALVTTESSRADVRFVPIWPLDQATM
jgi:predicted phosphodiesterase